MEWPHHSFLHVPPGPEEAKIRAVIERPAVQAALADPEIKKLIVLLKHQPDRAQR